MGRRRGSLAQRGHDPRARGTRPPCVQAALRSDPPTHTAVRMLQWGHAEGSVPKVEVDCDRCHTGPEVITSQAREWPVTFIAVRCPHCHSEQIIKRGKTARGTQRSLCQNAFCTAGSFLLDYCNRGCV